MAAYALGPGLLSRQVRNLGTLLRQAERAAAAGERGRRRVCPSPRMARAGFKTLTPLRIYDRSALQYCPNSFTLLTGN